MHVPLATAASIAQVKPATVRKWVQRGQLIRYEDGYDVKEILHWIDQGRNQSMYGLRTTKPRDTDERMAE